jgi:hypothetical protein
MQAGEAAALMRQLPEEEATEEEVLVLELVMASPAQ